MVLQIIWNLKMVVIIGYMLVVAINCLVVLLGKPWVRKGGIGTLLVYLLLSPLTLLPSIYEVWKATILENAVMEEKVNSFVKGCERCDVVFESDTDAIQTGLFVIGFLGLDPGTIEFNALINALLETEVLQINESGTYVFNAIASAEIINNTIKEENDENNKNE